MKKLTTEWRVILGLVLLKLMIHLATNTNYELHRDALLYFSLGEHLDMGFVSVPPLIGLIAKIATSLLGDTVFALRLFPALIGGVSVLIIAKIVQELKGGIFAIVTACLAFILSPAFLRSNTLFQPVSFNQFFWLLSGYLIIRLLNTRDPRYWLYIFLVWGIAFLNKYSIAFLIIATLAAFPLTYHRELMKSKYFIYGGILGIVIILPNLIWQHTHGWPLVHHLAGLQKYQFANVTVSGFLIGQVLMNLHAMVIWFAGLLYFLFASAEKKYRIFAYIYIFTVLIILLLSGKSY
jgi:4-amino-4-deoxy-L-arabinose transferase-like glycosyltransferase